MFDMDMFWWILAGLCAVAIVVGLFKKIFKLAIIAAIVTAIVSAISLLT